MWGEETAVGENPYAKTQLGKDLKFDHCLNPKSSAALECHAMTARDALSGRGRRRRVSACISSKRSVYPRGVCRRERLTNDPGRWAWCSDCVTVSDDYGVAVNPIPEFAKTH